MRPTMPWDCTHEWHHLSVTNPADVEPECPQCGTRADLDAGRVRDRDQAHADALAIDAMRERVLAGGKGLISADRDWVQGQLAQVAIADWTDGDLQTFADFMAGYDPRIVVRFDEQYVQPQRRGIAPPEPRS